MYVACSSERRVLNKHSYRTAGNATHLHHQVELLGRRVAHGLPHDGARIVHHHVNATERVQCKRHHASNVLLAAHVARDGEGTTASRHNVAGNGMDLRVSVQVRFHQGQSKMNEAKSAYGSGQVWFFLGSFCRDSDRVPEGYRLRLHFGKGKRKKKRITNPASASRRAVTRPMPRLAPKT